MIVPAKRAVYEALCASLQAAHETMVAAAKDAAAGATHEENRAEGIKDMRSTEQSYVARGQAMRAEELADELARLEATAPKTFAPDAPISAGALVRVELEPAGDRSEVEERLLFVCPQGGGTVLDVDGARVTVVTPSAPIGRALLGKREGDDFDLVVHGRKREGTIAAVW